MSCSRTSLQCRKSGRTHSQVTPLSGFNRQGGLASEAESNLAFLERTSFGLSMAGLSVVRQLLSGWTTGYARVEC